ncbi:hypothetical protein [Azospirillum sp. sgz302134]
MKEWKKGDEGTLELPGSIYDGASVTVVAITDAAVILEHEEGHITIDRSALTCLWPVDTAAPTRIH